jgi:hypothetical protein
VVAEDGPHGTVRVGVNDTTPDQVALTGRATSVPFTAVMTGPERTTTDNVEAAFTSAVCCLRRSRVRPIWLCEQGVAPAEGVNGLTQSADPVPWWSRHILPGAGT